MTLSERPRAAEGDVSPDTSSGDDSAGDVCDATFPGSRSTSLATTLPISLDWLNQQADERDEQHGEAADGSIEFDRYRGTRRLGRCLWWDVEKEEGAIVDDEWGEGEGLEIATSGNELFAAGEKRLYPNEIIEYRLNIVGTFMLAEEVSGPNDAPCGRPPSPFVPTSEGGGASPVRRPSTLSTSGAFRINMLKSELRAYHQRRSPVPFRPSAHVEEAPRRQTSRMINGMEGWPSPDSDRAASSAPCSSQDASRVALSPRAVLLPSPSGARTSPRVMKAGSKGQLCWDLAAKGVCMQRETCQHAHSLEEVRIRMGGAPAEGLQPTVTASPTHTRIHSFSPAQSKQPLAVVSAGTSRVSLPKRRLYPTSSTSVLVRLPRSKSRGDDRPLPASAVQSCEQAGEKLQEVEKIRELQDKTTSQMGLRQARRRNLKVMRKG